MRFASLSLLLLFFGCDCGSEPPVGCRLETDCAAGQICLDGMCQARADAAVLDAADAHVVTDTLDDRGPRCPSPSVECGAECCEEGEACRFGSCVSDLGPCTTNNDCWGDSYCEAGRCIPYGIPAGHDHDPSCERSIDIESIAPQVQCRWTGPPDGDANPNEIQVMATPAVIDLDLDSDPSTLAPSIVFASFPTAGSYRNPGVLRIIDGENCEQQFSFSDPADAVMSPAGVAAGDLDGDGRAEIIAAGHAGGLKAFRFDAEAGTFSRIWTSAVCDGDSRTADNTGGPDEWAGPSIHDLDDDGIPELIYGSVVYDNEGCVITSTLGYAPYSQGVVPVIADVDEDGAMELVNGDGVWEFDAATRDWVLESYFAGPAPRGQVAVADFGNFPIAALGDADFPEIAVIAAGQARVLTIDGTVIFGPVALPGGGTGGAPTIADFDGDGRREFASAGGSQYIVFDLDCQTEGGVGRCGSERTDGVLWTQPSQDRSSNVTGSSVFDFDADGAAEAVYADECFLRIYDGATGEVRYSAARSSGTTYENPVIVDVDGDFHSEIVSSANDYACAGIACPATDPLQAGTVSECNHGIVVLRDVMDRWAASRPVWNQHAYAVTHVGEHGEIPRSSTVVHNWSDPDLNNFRQNVQGELDALGQADLSANSEEGPLMVLCDAEGVATLPARICNRGTLPLAAGTEIAFRAGTMDGPELCRAPVPVALTVGMCTEVTCTGMLPAESSDLFVVVDPDDEEDECWEGNNFAVLRDVQCEIVN